MSNKWLPIIAVAGLACVGLGIYSVLSKSESGVTQNLAQLPQSAPVCVVSYSSGSCWTITPPQTKCGSLSTPKPSVSVNGDIFTVVVPANVSGVSVGQSFQKGDQLDIQATGFVAFSSDHPCAPPEGVNGWYDPNVDSPFKQNVGGLEMSLDSQRYLVGSQRTIKTDTTAVPVFRMIDRASGHNGRGAFTVTIKKR